MECIDMTFERLEEIKKLLNEYNYQYYVCLLYTSNYWDANIQLKVKLLKEEE